MVHPRKYDGRSWPMYDMCAVPGVLQRGHLRMEWRPGQHIQIVLSSPLLSAAYEAGIDVDGARIESHDGYTMVSEDGSWIIGPSGNPKQSSISSNRSSFDAGICTGKFHTVMVIKNRLEWGAQTSCVSAASPNEFYRHSLHIELRQQDEGQFLFKKGQRLYPAKWPVLSCYLCSGN